ncbi:MAG: hypothetical protein ACI9WU_004454, partial [Myxococcota bacterium]
WYADTLRQTLAADTRLLEVWDLGQQAIFADTPTPASVLICQKSPASADHRVAIRVGDERRTILQSELGASPWRLRAKPVSGATRLGDLCDLSQGMQTGCNSVFAGITDQDRATLGLEADALRRRAVGLDIQPGQLTDRKRRWAVWTEDRTQESLPPNVAAWLATHRSRLEARAAFRRGDCDWFRWSWPRPGQLGRPKLLCPYRASLNRFCFDASGEVVGLTDTTVLLPRSDMPVHPLELMARLNDAEHTRRQLERAKPTGQGLYEYFASQLQELPVSL